MEGSGTYCTKMGADNLAENTTNALEFICSSPKVLDFNEKRLHWVSVVRDSSLGCKWEAPHHIISINVDRESVPSIA